MSNAMLGGLLGIRTLVSGGTDFERKAFHLRKGFLYSGHGGFTIRSTAGDKLGRSISLAADTFAAVNMFGDSLVLEDLVQQRALQLAR